MCVYIKELLVVFLGYSYFVILINMEKNAKNQNGMQELVEITFFKSCWG